MNGKGTMVITIEGHDGNAKHERITGKRGASAVWDSMLGGF
jgi:hypothetical protein